MNNSSFRALFFFLPALALTACAASAEPDSSAEETLGQTAAALKDNGGGPNRLGFTCEGSSCECSKDVPNDCENMRKNCTGGLPELDACIDGWLTTHCTCSYGRVVSTPIRPFYLVPTEVVTAAP